MPEVATPNQAEREFETASDEFFKNQSQVNAGYGNVLFANIKRTYDVYQDLDVQAARQSLKHAGWLWLTKRHRRRNQESKESKNETTVHDKIPRVERRTVAGAAWGALSAL